MNAFDFTVEVQDGSKVELSKFKGKVLAIVNTATGCGFTPQYSKVDVNGDNAIPFYKWITENTCSKVISMDIDGDIVKNIEFMGGCNGNLKTIPLLLDGLWIRLKQNCLESSADGGRLHAAISLQRL